VVRVSLVLRSELVTVTVAAGTTAPEESYTVPLKEARATCPDMDVGTDMRQNAISKMGMSARPPRAPREPNLNLLEPIDSSLQFRLEHPAARTGFRE